MFYAISHLMRDVIPLNALDRQGIADTQNLHQLSRLYLLLLDAAVAGGGNASWNSEGYYLVENGEHRWNELAEEIAFESQKQGFIKSAEVKILEGEEWDKLKAVGVALWNVKSRAKAVRASEVLGWKPSERSLKDEVPDIVGSEAKRIGLASGQPVPAGVR